MTGTTTPPWDTTFEGLIRQALEQFPPDQELTPDLDFTAAGLDSLAVVELLMHVEEVYGVVIPDELLTSETFATPGSLWAVIAGLGRESD